MQAASHVQISELNASVNLFKIPIFCHFYKSLIHKHAIKYRIKYITYIMM